MTIKCKFSPLGKSGVDAYEPGYVLYEVTSVGANKTVTKSLPIRYGVFELMCCSGGGGQWCYYECNKGAAGSFFKGVVFFNHDQTLEISVGGAGANHNYSGKPTSITNCIYCPGGRAANSTCPGSKAAPTLYDGMEVLSTEINAGGVCNGGSLFSGMSNGGNLRPGYFKLTYLRLEP